MNESAGSLKRSDNRGYLEHCMSDACVAYSWPCLSACTGEGYSGPLAYTEGVGSLIQSSNGWPDNPVEWWSCKVASCSAGSGRQLTTALAVHVTTHSGEGGAATSVKALGSRCSLIISSRSTAGKPATLRTIRFDFPLTRGTLFAR